jgi:hypothetical protein
MKESSLAFVLDALASLLIVAAGLGAYDRYRGAACPGIGVVDVAEVYRAKEAEFTQILTRADFRLRTRQQAMLMARDFAQRPPWRTGGVATR